MLPAAHPRRLVLIVALMASLGPSAVAQRDDGWWWVQLRARAAAGRGAWALPYVTTLPAPMPAPPYREPALQTRPWRVAVGGAWATGYMGLLARHGMPRERLLDTQLTDPSVLKQYQIVIVTDPRTGGTGPDVTQALDQYVRDGGIAIVEPIAILGQTAIRGVRVALGTGASLVFVDSGHPISKELVSRGTIPLGGWSVVAVVPQDDPDVRVLAKFVGGRIAVSGRQDLGASLTEAPAILLKPVGEGYFLYLGVGLSRMLALRGPELEDIILAAIRHFSDGQIVPRFTTPKSRAQLVAHAPVGQPIPPSAPPPGAEERETVPPGFEVLEADAPVPAFNLTAALPPNGDAELLFDYWNASWCRSLRFGSDGVELRTTEDGHTRTIRRAELAGDDRAGELLIKRREGSLVVLAGGQPILTAADHAPWQGAIACRNLPGADLQVVMAPYLSDDFMRREGDFGGWETVAGTWKVQSTEGTPEKGANPFSYEFSSASRAIATGGHWFLDDYAVSAAAQWRGTAAGLCGHYEDPSNYLLLELRGSDGRDPGDAATIVRVTEGRREVLAEAPAACSADQWYQLGLRISGGWIAGVLDGRVVVEAEDARRGQGGIALYADGATGRFDDVQVRPWHAIVQRAGASLLDDLGVACGEWTDADDCTLRGRGGGKAGARAVSGWRDSHPVACSAAIRPRDGAAGFCVRYQDEGNYSMLLVAGGQKGVVRLLRVADGRTKLIAEKRHHGGEYGWWHLRAELRGPRITALVDDEPVLDVVQAPVEPSGVGLCTRGNRPAEFRNVRIVSLDEDMGIADPPTPNFAGIIDRHTWAGAAASWLPQAEAIGRFWHHARFPGDVRLSIGVHRDDSPKVSAHAILGDGSHIDAGYTLTATHTWGSGTAAVALRRKGEAVATCAASVPKDAGSFLLQLERAGAAVLGALDGQLLIAYNDRNSLAGTDRLGVEATGTRLWPDDIAARSPHAKSYVFSEAPVDWLVESGTWEIARRWECEQEWTWFAGWSDETAAIRNKHRFGGDLLVDMYVGPKMMASGAPGLPSEPLGDATRAPLIVRERRYREDLSDIHIRLCAEPGDEAAGYTFVVAGQGRPGAILKKNGHLVAEAPGFVVPQASIHNDWVDFSVEKSGDLLGLYCFGQPVLEYRDPAPLAGGYVTIGTYHNAILIPRVTIHGRAEAEPNRAVAGPVLISARRPTAS